MPWMGGGRDVSVYNTVDCFQDGKKETVLATISG